MTEQHAQLLKEQLAQLAELRNFLLNEQGALTIQEAARSLGVSRCRVDQLVNLGRMRSYKCALMSNRYVSALQVAERLANRPPAGRPFKLI